MSNEPWTKWSDSCAATFGPESNFEFPPLCQFRRTSRTGRCGIAVGRSRLQLAFVIVPIHLDDDLAHSRLSLVERAKTGLESTQNDCLDVGKWNAQARVGQPEFLRHRRVRDQPIVGIHCHAQPQIKVELERVERQIPYRASLNITRWAAF